MAASQILRVNANHRAATAWRVLWRTIQEFFEDSIPTVAGGITFFCLLALFPAIASVVSLYGLFADRSEIIRDVDLIADFLPGGAITVLRTELLRLAKLEVEANVAFFVSLALALWSASGGYRALIYGLNVAYEVKETRSFWQLALNAVIFTALAVAVSAIVLNLGLGLPSWLEAQRGSAVTQAAAQLVVWIASFLAFAVVLGLVYRVGPDRARPMKWMSWGSVAASGFWLVGTRLFTWYVQNFGSYDQVYGSLGAVIGFMTWIWLSFVVILLGAELNCELERSRSN